MIVLPTSAPDEVERDGAGEDVGGEEGEDDAGEDGDEEGDRAPSRRRGGASGPAAAGAQVRTSREGAGGVER